MRKRGPIATIAAFAAVAALAPQAVAGTGVAPAEGATVGVSPTFVVDLAADETIPRVQVATRPATTATGFASGLAGLCTPSQTAEGKASCTLSTPLKPGRYWWLLTYQKPDECRNVNGREYCILRGHVQGPWSFTVSTKPPAPTKPPVAGRPAPSGGAVARPTTAGAELAYVVPEAPPVVGRRAVVHYVTSGLDAPPLNDDDADGVPDYVEDVRDAADTAFDWFAGRGGFRPPRPDAAGPDALPDVYVKHLRNPDLYGLAVAPRYAEGGSFVVVSPRLDRSPKLARGSLPLVVAHEAFHVVQYAYVPDGTMPRWIAEGSAVAMSLLVYPEILDLTNAEYLDRWLAEPWRPLHDERFYCNRCYGGAWWWEFLLADPKLVPQFFARLDGYRQSKRPLRTGLQPLAETIRARSRRTLGGLFADFAVDLYRSGLRPRTAYALTATRHARTTRPQRVPGLASHYVRLVAPPGAHGFELRMTGARAADLDVVAVLGGPKGRAFRAVGGRLRLSFASARERRVTLVLSARRALGARYRLTYRAF